MNKDYLTVIPPGISVGVVVLPQDCPCTAREPIAM